MWTIDGLKKKNQRNTQQKALLLWVELRNEGEGHLGSSVN